MNSRFLKTLSILCLVVFFADRCSASNTTSFNLEYLQHWKTGDARPYYGKGPIVAEFPTAGETASEVKFTMQLNGHPSSSTEWNYGRESVWDLVASDDTTTWTAIMRDVAPTEFTNSPGGKMVVKLNLPLGNTNGQDKQRLFEIYGTRWGMNVSPPNRHGANFLIRGKVTWRTDANGVTQACSVTFGGQDQAKNLGGTSPYFPQRKVDSDRDPPNVSAYTTGLPEDCQAPPGWATSTLNCCPCAPSCVVYCPHECRRLAFRCRLRR